MYFSKVSNFCFFLVFTLLFSFLVPVKLSAQTPKERQDLENDKKNNQKKMQEIQDILKKTSTQKNVSLGQLKAINQEINTQKKQIDLINDDIVLTGSEMQTLQRAKKNLDENLIELKKEYGHMIYEASKRNTFNNQLIFLFSSSNFNQFLLRYKYLKQYTDARNAQARQMQDIQKKIASQQTEIAKKQQQQKTVLIAKVQESTKLEGLKVKQNQAVTELSKKEGQLRAELAESQRAAARLEANIRKWIERENRERRERAERERRERAAAERLAREKAEPGAPSPPPSEPEPISSGMTEEEVKLASSFSASQRRLPWPVRGFVSEHFGLRPHAVFKSVMVDNLGVNIQTSPGEAVRTVYDGVVLDVTEMVGMGNVVAIQHGNFMTVYAKMKSVSVSAGQKVSARDAIGTVSTDSEGTAELQFQIWKNTTRLNPESWLRAR